MRKPIRKPVALFAPEPVVEAPKPAPVAVAAPQPIPAPVPEPPELLAKLRKLHSEADLNDLAAGKMRLVRLSF